jgi:uncharacterized protein (TIGR03435 family)
MRSFLFVLTAAVALAQQFEVATIKTTESDIRAIVTAAGGRGAINLSNIGMRVNGNQVNFGFMSLRDLVMMAYEVKPTQIKAPEWLAQQRYDIQALMPEGADQKQLPAMLQALLKDRFKLVAHKDSKEQDVMALEAAKGGHKMKEAAPLDLSAAATPPPPGSQTITAGGQQISIQGARGGAGTATISTPATGSMKMSMGQDGQMHMEVERMTMQQLADQLTSMNELAVVDRTGLTGAFQVSLDISMADMLATARRSGALAGVALPPGFGGAPAGTPAGLGASDPGGDMSSTLGKLGLRLEKTKVVMESLTVESAEKTPTEN